MSPGRPRLRRLLEPARRRPLTLVVAGAGWGKTTALRELGADAWLDLLPPDRDVRRLADRLAGVLGLELVAAELASTGPDDPVQLAEAMGAELAARAAGLPETLCVVDGVEAIADDDGAAAWTLLRTFCLQLPPSLHLVVSGRRLPSLRAMPAAPRLVADDLALTPAEVADLVGPDAAGPAHDATGGWPVAVALLGDQPDLGRARPWRAVARDVVEEEQPASRQALALAHAVGVVAAGLLVAASTGSAGGPMSEAEAERIVDDLVDRGLLVGSAEIGLLRLSPALEDAVGDPADDGWRLAVARWLDERGDRVLALRCLRPLGPDAVRDHLRRHGNGLVRGGLAAEVAEVLDAVGPGDDADLAALLGTARQAVGDLEGAAAAFRGVRGPLPADAAWRYAALLYLAGDTDAGLTVLDTSRPPVTGADEALVAAWRSSLLWSTGRTDEAAAAAEHALATADAAGDPTALAAAHTASALVAASRGDREANDKHYREALIAATEAGDPVQLTRVRSNLSSRAYEEGDYRLAVVEADEALRIGAGHSVLAGLALANKAEALIVLGDLDEARAVATDALASFARTASTLGATAHLVIATIDRERGDLTKAKLGLERAIRLSDSTDDPHTAAYARALLARTIARDDAPAAREHVTRALEQASSLERATVLVAAAWTELAGGNHATALARADDAVAAAEPVADLRSLAEALEARALAVDPPSADLLAEALKVWGSMQAPVGTLRCRLALARVRGDALEERTVLGELAARGLTPESGAPALLPSPASEATAVRVETLGRFRVLRDGVVVPVSEWQSRKARDLLKLLVARRGRVLTREAVAAELWPDEDPEPLANRLSVLLSTVRKVLDPERRLPADHYLAADGDALAVRTDRLAVDVWELVDAVREAQRVDGAGATSRVVALLGRADRLYQGDFLEEDAYADWAVDCREEALDAVQAARRRLAVEATTTGDDDAALGHLRRLLERDPYDEPAWLAVIGALLRLRRHGEARRQHARYARAMAELDVPAVPLEGLANRTLSQR